MTVLSVSELYELHEQLIQKMGTNDLLHALTLANRQGNLENMLAAMGYSSVLKEKTMKCSKILVIGASQVKIGKLKAVASKAGFDSKDFEFYLEYDGIKHFNFKKLKYNDNYLAVLVGPQPHSTAGKGNSSSAIAEMEANPEAFPQIIRIQDSNELKITATGFRKALLNIQF